MELQKVLHENHIRMYKEEIKKRKKEQKKEKMLSIFIGIFIVIAAITILVLNNKIENGALKNCIDKGHSQNYCLNHV